MSQSPSPPSSRRPRTTPPGLPLGASVAVWSRFEGSWSNGFEVAELLDTSDGPRLKVRRVSDGAVLPALFAADDLNPRTS